MLIFYLVAFLLYILVTNRNKYENKNRIGLLVSLILITYLSVLTACKNENEEPIPEEQISYTSDVQLIWDTKGCMNCHNTGGTSPVLTSDVSYNNLVPSKVDLANPEQSIVYTVLDGWMAGTVTEDDKEVVLKWIEQGAKDN